MLKTSISLKQLSQLPDPQEGLSDGTQNDQNRAHQLILDRAFEDYSLKVMQDGVMNLLTSWSDSAVVKVTEESRHGSLKFSCSRCLSQGRQAASCPHQVATFLTLWQATHPEQNPEGVPLRLSKALKPFLDENEHFDFSLTKLESISLIFDEAPLLRTPGLTHHMNEDMGRYRLHQAMKDQEILSPRLWNLPEVFRKKLQAFSGHYFHEVNKLNRLADRVRYNFSNGYQVSAREILRHPLQRKVPTHLLPQAKAETQIFNQWPMNQSLDESFVSEAQLEVMHVMQALISEIALHQRREKMDLYLQNGHQSEKGLKIQSIEFDPSQELDWRVEFFDRKPFVAELKLVSFRNRDLFFFSSFALEPENGVIIVHPWLRELSLLQEKMLTIKEGWILPKETQLKIEIEGEGPTQKLLQHLRTRSIPVKVAGISREIAKEKTALEIRLNERGDFYIVHTARVPGSRDLNREGFSSVTEDILHTLSEGLPSWFKMEARDLAARAGLRRDWDLKLLKHLGVLQYVTLETLSVAFENQLLDGRHVERDELIEALYKNIQTLLIQGSGESFVREQSLQELCSRSVLALIEKYIHHLFDSIPMSETYFSEEGEIKAHGVVERELRLIFELLKMGASTSGGETFKKVRTGLLTKIQGKTQEDLGPQLYRFPGTNSLMEGLEALQTLIPEGFKIFYKDQILQELQEDEFRIDFILESDTRNDLFNWFELNPKFFLQGEEVPPENFLQLGGGGVVEYKGKLFLVPRKQIPSLRRLENFWEKLQKGKVETTKRKGGDKIYKLPRHQTLELLALRASGIGIRGDEQWKKICDFYDGLGKSDRELKLSPTIKAELKPYQLRGTQWLEDLYHLKMGALLADDMGLGKTLQTLSFLENLNQRGALGPVLVIVPSSLIFNWQNEIEKFTPNLPWAVFTNKDREKIARRVEAREPLVVIATYGLLMEHDDFLAQFKWQILVFDEAQNLKNITTKRTSAARSLSAQFKIGLTGTPMENHYGEFYSLIDILVPGSLGRLEDFRRQFVNTDMITREEMDDLKLKIKPLIMRRTKKEILDQLPEKQETKVSIAFEEKQKQIYRDIALSYNQRVQETLEVQGEARVQLQMLTALLRLRQACSDPASLPNVEYEKVPPKLETLLDSLTEIVESGESALVFTQFLQTLERTARLLKEAGVPVYVLHGGVPTAQRQKVLADFNKEPGGAVLVMTLKTGGVGLNLTKASYVFHLEPWWNPSVENQATDRAHRLGQNKAVQVFRYIMHESLEEKIEVLKERKDKKFQSLFTTTEKDIEVGQNASALTKQDFDLLLGL